MTIPAPRRHRLSLLAATAILSCLAPMGAAGQARVAAILVSRHSVTLEAGDSAIVRVSYEDGKNAEISPEDARGRARSRNTNVAVTRLAAGQLIITAVRAGTTSVELSVQGQTMKVILVVVEAAEAASAGMPPPPGASPPRSPSPRGEGSGRAGTRRVARLDVGLTELRLAVGERMRLRVDAFDSAGQLQPGAPVRFLSLHPQVLSIDSLGELSALSAGGGTVVVQDPAGPAYTSVQVRVEAPLLALAMDTAWFWPGTRDTFEVLVAPEGRPYRGPVVWSGGEPGAVTVDEGRAVVTTRQPGTSTLRATAAGQVMTVVVVVLPREHEQVIHPAELGSAAPTLPLGSRRALRIVAQDSLHRAMHDLPVTWTAADTSIAQVDTIARTLTARKIGTTTVRAEVRYVRPDRVATVYTYAVRVVGGGVRLEPARLGLRVGERRPLAVVALDSLRRPVQDSFPVDWEAGPASVFRHLGNGILEGVAVGGGTASVSTAWGSSASARVYVVPSLYFTYITGSRETGGVDELRSLDLATRQVRLVPQPAERAREPAVSPDRTRIAYTGLSPGRRNSDLWVMNSDGSEAVNIVGDTFPESSPAWSAEGEWIFFVQRRGSASERVYAIRHDGTGLHPMTDSVTKVRSVSASPDGGSLVYSAVRGDQYDLMQLPLREGALASGEPRVLLPGPDNEFSPKFASGTGDLYFLRLERDGRRRYLLMRLRRGVAEPEQVTDAGLVVRDYSIAPDGAQAVLAAERGGARGRDDRLTLYLVGVGPDHLGAPELLLDDVPSARAFSPAFTP